MRNVDAGSAALAAEPAAPWLVTAKVTVPELADGYLHRPSLIRQFDSVADRRISVLRAPGGFGKTTTLSEICRRARKRGMLVAWLTVDEDDVLGLFGAHLAYAFTHAGLDLTAQSSEDAWTSNPLTHQIGMFVRVIETHAAPCLLVLDELDRLPEQSVDLLDRLLRQGPRNLHFALSFRSNPGLDLASIVLDGSGVIATTDQFRFSKPEVHRFFDGNLTRHEVDNVLARTDGWPVALRIDRDMWIAGPLKNAELGEALTRNFLDTRLLRRLPDADRALLLDLAVFDWIDMDLADEVLELTDTRARVESLVALDGLLTSVERNGAVRRLHPLVREHCHRVLAREDPVRKRRLHRRLAEALVQRGRLVPAWRHAAETGDLRFLGEMMERVGVFRMWLSEGMTCVSAADRFLTPALLEEYPRLALIRCVACYIRREFTEAHELLRTITPRLDDLARRSDLDASTLLLDRLCTEVALAGAHARLASDRQLQALSAARPEDAATAEQASLVRSGSLLISCISSYHAGSYEICRPQGLRALSHARRGGYRHGEVFVSLTLGMAAMAQGCVEEAAGHYADARRVTKAFFASDPALATIVDVLVIELDLERDREKAIEQRPVGGLTSLRASWTDIQEAALAVAAELNRTRYGPEVGVGFLEEEIAKARAAGLEAIVRYASALLSHALVDAGHAGRAERAWRDGRLPTDPADLFDLDRQSWREMEALSCARIGLLTALGNRDAAGDLAQRLRALTSARGLKRTLMRALVLSMALDADTDGAIEPLVEFLGLTRDTDYLRPLVRRRDLGRALLTRLIETNPEPALHEAAASALARLDGPPSPADASLFSPREQDVLAAMGNGLRNREIADRLGVTEDGVRHHLKNIYRKTGTTDRDEAVRRAAATAHRS